MAEELFIGKLDPKKVKVCVYQTKFWPEYRRDKVYGKGSSTGSSYGSTETTNTAAFSGSTTGQSFYTPDSWFGTTMPGSSSELSSSGSTTTSGSASSSSDSYATSESEVDIPIFFPVPFQELSSIQYYSVEEQLTELASALKLQFQRHCFIQIRQQETQPMLVPFVEPVVTFTYNRTNLDWYINRQHERQKALPAAEIDRLLQEQETALLQAAANAVPAPDITLPTALPEGEQQPTEPPKTSIWNRGGSPTKAASGTDSPVSVPIPLPRKRGPKPDVESHDKVVRILSAYGENWTTDASLQELCSELDEQGVPVPKTWATRRDGSARSWNRARQYYPHLVIKAIKDRCKAAQAACLNFSLPKNLR